ncbi:hypothetical protein ACFWBV_35495, partial [Streptomyces sp. NPDC060030]
NPDDHNGPAWQLSKQLRDHFHTHPTPALPGGTPRTPRRRTPAPLIHTDPQSTHPGPSNHDSAPTPQHDPVPDTPSASRTATPNNNQPILKPAHLGSIKTLAPEHLDRLKTHLLINPDGIPAHDSQLPTTILNELFNPSSPPTQPEHDTETMMDGAAAQVRRAEKKPVRGDETLLEDRDVSPGPGLIAPERSDSDTGPAAGVRLTEEAGDDHVVLAAERLRHELGEERVRTYSREETDHTSLILTTESSLQDAAVAQPDAVRGMSPPLSAGVGFEIEMPGVNLSNPSRGEVLIQGVDWRLETDDAITVSNLEFVFSPMATAGGIADASADIVGVVARMRQLALQNPSRKFAIADVAGGSIRPVTVIKDDIAIVNDPQFSGRLQVTYGISLSEISSAIDDLLTKKQANSIHAKVKRVREEYMREHSSALTAEASGFIELIIMYLERAAAPSHRGATVHGLFRMMARSDFSSMHDRLLTPESRHQVQRLILRKGENALPELMQCLGIDEAHPVFKKPYEVLFSSDRFAGPTVIEWLHSIVHGRQDGLFKKDLLSPPWGAPTHSGNLDVDYGMGAMGVDEESKLVLFEVRGAPYRPESIPVNGRVLHSLLTEYGKATLYNKSLPTFSGTLHPDVLQIDRIGAAFTGLQTTIKAAGKPDHSFTELQTRMLRNAFIELAQELEIAGSELSETSRILQGPLKATVSHIRKINDEPQGLFDAKNSTWLSNLDNLTSFLGEALWTAGDETGKQPHLDKTVSYLGLAR